MPELDNLDFFGGRLKLRHVVVALTVAEKGSTVAAASALYVSQPAVTRLVAELEDILGARLFERTSHGMVPTEFAEPFLDHGRAALAHLRNGARHVTERADGQVGGVRVGVHLAGASVLLPRAVAAVKADRPRLQVTIVDGVPRDLRTAVAEGDLDLVVSRVGSFPPSSPGSGEQLLVEELTDEQICVVAGSGSPHVEAGPRTLQDVVGEPWIVPHPGMALRAELEAAFAAAGAPFPENLVEASSLTAMHGLLPGSRFLAAVPEATAALVPGVRRLDLPEVVIDRRIVLVRAANHPLPPAAAVLRDALFAVAREEHAERRRADGPVNEDGAGDGPAPEPAGPPAGAGGGRP